MFLIGLIMLSFIQHEVSGQAPSFTFSREYSIHLKPDDVALDSDGNIYATDALHNRISVYSPEGELLRAFGNRGTGDGEMNYPSRIALGSENRIYVLDSRNYRVQVFNNDGSFHKTIGGYGLADGLFLRPSDIAVDRNDILYVVDAIRNNVQVFDADGNFVKTLANEGTEDGKLSYPYSLAVDDNLFVYVIDSHRTGNSFRLQIFSPEGVFADKLDVPLYANGVAIAQNGDIYIGDDYNEKIAIYDRLTGELINSYPVFTSQLLLGTLTGIAIGPNGDVYVASAWTSRIDVHDQVGVKLRTIGLPRGSFDGQFNNVESIAVDGSDNIYVLDDNHVHVLDPTGKFLRKFGALGTGDGAFINPADVTVDKNGYVYVMDAGNRRVVVFNNDGSFSRAFNVNTPHNNTTEGIAVGGDGRIYVVNTFIRSIEVYENDGDYLFSFGSQGNGDGQFQIPKDIVVSGDGNVLVSEVQTPDRIQIFDSNGNFIRAIGSTGSGEGQLAFPRDIAIDPSGKIYVCDVNNDRLQIFNSDGSVFGIVSSQYYDGNDWRFTSGNGVAVNSAGHIIVGDASDDYITGITTRVSSTIEDFESVTMDWTPDPIMLTGNSSHRYAITYNVVNDPSNTATVVINNDKMTVQAPGTVKIRADANADAEFLAASKEVTFEFLKLDQEIFFKEIPDMFNSALPTQLKLAVWSSSGLPVDLTLTEGEDVVTLVDSTITVHFEHGSVSVNAEQSGNTFYNPAALVSRSFIIQKDPVLDLMEQSLEQIDVVPNPASEKFVVQDPSQQIRCLTLANVQGRKLAEYTGLNSTEHEISVRNLAPGLYILRANDSSGRQMTERVAVR